MTTWYKIESKADKAEIWIYEMIGKDFWTGDGVTAKGFQKQLSELKASQIDLHINSPGGEVFDGITIYNLIKNHPAKVTTYIDGLAASIASVIALAGDRVVMSEGALFMIHNPWGMAMGDAAAMRKMADALDKVGGSIATAYVGKTGKPEPEILELMSAETWFSADEAKEIGFADEITERAEMAACSQFVPAMVQAKFKNIPDKLSGQRRAPENERDLERVLRDAGYSRKTAQSIIARGFRGSLRDAGNQPASQPSSTIASQPANPSTCASADDALRDADASKPKLNSRTMLLVKEL